MKTRLLAFALAALALASAHAQITVDDTVTFTTSPNNTFMRGSPYTFQAGGVFNPSLEARTIPGALAGFDPTGSDKLIVTFGSENAASVASITYGGVAMSPAVVANNGAQFTGIYYLDNPTGPGDLVITFSGASANGVGGSLMAVSNTLIGSASVTASSPSQSATLTTAAANRLIAASHANNGTGGAAQSPFAALFNGPVGSGGGGSGYLNAPAIGTFTAAFTGSTSLPVTAAAAFAPTLPLNPAPYGIIIPGGEVQLTWQNLAPNSGSDVWVDVWFGTDPGNLTKVVAADPAGLNLGSFTTTTLLAGTYYWRVDSYLDGTPTGTPVTGSLLTFTITDTDNDGLTDAWEQLYFNDPTAAVASGDPDQDNLTNLQEFALATHPVEPDTDSDGLLDGNSITVPGGDPRYGAWATAGIFFTQNGSDRTFRGENQHGTDPLDPDTDGDTLSDGVETHTGIFASASDTGTDPLNPDTDADGLPDSVETHTGIHQDSTNTGTNPLAADTDNDNVGDWYEISASFTSPFDPNDKPAVPYPLPDPDSSSGAADQPVKVYIMSGQSNMVGAGVVGGTADGSLETITRRQNKFPNLINGTGAWTARQDVRYRGVITAVGNGPLAPGFGSGSDKIGPELGFGHIMGWYHDAPVLLLKSSDGNRALGWDLLPAGSPSYQYDGYQYAAYGESPRKWLIGETPIPINWYAGKEFDRFFMDESEWAHPDTAKTNVVDVLDNWVAEYGGAGKPFAGHDFEIAGFVWWQGDKDRYDMGLATRYETNLVKLIDSLRGYYSNRYPGKVVHNAPFVLATLGQTVLGDNSDPAEKAILDAQLAVDGNAGNYLRFAGNVKTVYAHPLSQGGASNSHYNGNAETYMLVGDALGRAMVDLQDDASPPAPNPMTFATPPTAVDATTVGMVATAASDASGPVQYWFENTSNSTNSGWIASTRWDSTGLSNAQSYDFRVKAKDSKGNETGFSATASATPGNDITPPTPDPMSFATPPAALGETAIAMTATTATDSSGVEYYFEATDGGHDSGWQDSEFYTDTGLTPAHTYNYRVRARDMSANQIPTAWSAAVPATTTAAAAASAIAVTNSLTVAGPKLVNGANMSATVADWAMNGGNAIAVYFTAENAASFTASYGSQPMTVVAAFDGERFLTGIAYLIQPTATVGDVVINATNSGTSRLSHAYSILSLDGVGSVAATDSRTSNGTLGYTTTSDGGYVLGAAVNNSYNGSTLPAVVGNPSAILLQSAVDGNASMLHAHGPVTAAGNHSDNYSGTVESAVTVAFNSGGGTPAAPYDAWAATFPGLADPAPALDFDGGSLATALEWVLGGNPADPSDDAGLLPTIDNTSDLDFFIFTFNRTDQAKTDPATRIAVEYGGDLHGWTTAAAGPDIVINETDHGTTDTVQVKLRRTLAPNSGLFVRLGVLVTTP